MTDTPLISIVLPTYNRVRFVGEAIESALAQTWTNLEVLVVDDGSRDSTPRVLADYASRDGRVRAFRQANQGVSAARNFALSQARGEWIAFLDSDDIWHPWKLSLQLRVASRFPEVGMLWTNMDAIRPDKTPHQANYLKRMYSAYQHLPGETPFPELRPLSSYCPEVVGEWKDADVGVGDIYSTMFRGNLVHTPTVLVKQEWARQVGPFDTGMLRGGEDFKYHLATCRLGPVAFIDVPSILYRVGIGDHITNRENSLHFARSFLRTLHEELHQHRSRLALSSAQIRAALADAHDWLADELLENGQSVESAIHALRAMGTRRTPGRSWRTLLKSLLPRRLVDLLRRAKKPQPPASREGTAERSAVSQSAS